MRPKYYIKIILLVILAVLVGPFAVLAGDNLKPTDAVNHVGEQAEVCGKVASATFSTRSNGKPTFLNLGIAFPNHVFTVVVWGNVRPKFSYSPESLEGKTICVQGLITEYQGNPQIVVSGPSQLRIISKL